MIAEHVGGELATKLLDSPPIENACLAVDAKLIQRIADAL